MIENGFRLYQGHDGLALAQIVNGMVYELEPSQADHNLPLGYYDDNFNLVQPELAKYDPNQLRAPAGTEEGGQWVEDPYRPKVLSNGYRQWETRMREVIAQLPASHMRAILNTDIKVVDKIPPMDPSLVDRGYTLGLWQGNKGSNFGLIKIAKGFQFKGRKAALRNPDATMVHEIGHAIDYALNQQPSKMLMGVMARDALTMTKVEKRQFQNAAYWLGSNAEMFAELYALAYTPGRQNKFFGMKRAGAEAKFKTSIATLKNYLDRTL